MRKQDSYDAGTIVEPIVRHDEWGKLRPDGIGTVQHMDDASQIQMRRRRRSGLTLIPAVDPFRIIGHEKHI